MQPKADILALKPVANSDAKKKVSEAAIRCFNQYGPQRTSMADIAEEAGISRKTLYRIFDDRPALIDYILRERMYVLGEKVRKKLVQYTDYEEALIEGSIYAVRVSRKDKLFNEIVKRDTNHRVEMLLLGPTDQLLSDIVDLWSIVVTPAREKGAIRDDLSVERIVELLANMHGLLLIRDDYDEAQQRAFLVDFLLPALRPR